MDSGWFESNFHYWSKKFYIRKGMKLTDPCNNGLELETQMSNQYRHNGYIWKYLDTHGYSRVY